MTIVVTGATGFIGRRLCDQLRRRGKATRAIFRRAAPPPIAGIDWRPLPDLVANPADWLPLLEGSDCVIHLAALAHQIGRDATENKQEFHRINVDGTANLARACVAAGVRRFIFMSSVAAIGAAESAADAGEYGHSKLEAEQAIEATFADTDVDWCILRPPLVYGPDNPGNMARLLRLIATGMPLPLAAIRNRRSFVYVENLVDAIISVVDHPRRIRDRFVVTDGTDLSTPDLIRGLADASGKRVRLFPVPLSVLRAGARLADLAGTLLGRSLPFDSYSVERLAGTLVFDGSPFRTAFSWSPPVDVIRALRSTFGNPDARRE